MRAQPESLRITHPIHCSYIELLALFELVSSCFPRFELRGHDLNPITTEANQVSVSDLLMQKDGRVDLPIRIENECDMAHFAVSELFLECHSELLKSCTRSFDVTAGDSDVTESTPRV